MSSTYTYVDLLNVIRDVGDSRLNYAGTWNAASTYSPFDVVMFNHTRYIALATSLGKSPTITSVRDNFWSALVFVSSGSSSSSVSGSEIANDALRIAVIGTNLGEQAYTIGVTALHTAWSGTQLAQTAYNLAALAYYIAGTAGGTGASADLSGVYSIAQTALETAWSGTNVGRSIVHCSAFTPLVTGPDAAEIVVPYAPDGSTLWNWSVRRLDFRVQTAGTGSSACIEKSPGAGGFSAVLVGTVAVADNAYEGYALPSGTLNSGDKVRFNAVTLGTTQNWTLITEISHP